MSDDSDDVQDDVDDPDVEDGEDVEPATPDDPDGPDLDDDDLVDVDEDMVAAVAGKSDDDEDESDVDDEQDTDRDGGDNSGSSKSPTETLTTGTSVGDMYCSALGMAAATARDSYGSGINDREAEIKSYADDARLIGLDDFVNEWMQEQGGIDELSPGQGIVIGTAMFAMGVMIEDPALAENIAEEVGA